MPEDAGTGWTTCMYFVAVLRGKEKQKAKGEAGCFPQGLWSCHCHWLWGLSLVIRTKQKKVLPPAVSPSWILVTCANHQT